MIRSLCGGRYCSFIFPFFWRSSILLLLFQVLLLVSVFSIPSLGLYILLKQLNILSARNPDENSYQKYEGSITLSVSVQLSKRVTDGKLKAATRRRARLLLLHPMDCGFLERKRLIELCVAG